MKKTKILIGVVAVLCVISLAGCGVGGGIMNDTKDNPNTNGDKTPVIENNDSLTENPTENNDANSLISHSSIQGSVIKFSDDSCTITPVEYAEGKDGEGDVAIVDAPGNENSDTTVTVHYGSDCEFQIERISTTTGKATFSDADISDIKKQTSLIIYGEWSNKNNINATRVIIARYE